MRIKPWLLSPFSEVSGERLPLKNAFFLVSFFFYLLAPFLLLLLYVLVPWWCYLYRQSPAFFSLSFSSLCCCCVSCSSRSYILSVLQCQRLFFFFLSFFFIFPIIGLCYRWWQRRGEPSSSIKLRPLLVYTGAHLPPSASVIVIGIDDVFNLITRVTRGGVGVERREGARDVAHTPTQAIHLPLVSRTMCVVYVYTVVAVMHLTFSPSHRLLSTLSHCFFIQQNVQ